MAALCYFLFFFAVELPTVYAAADNSLSESLFVTCEIFLARLEELPTTVVPPLALPFLPDLPLGGRFR